MSLFPKIKCPVVLLGAALAFGPVAAEEKPDISPLTSLIHAVVTQVDSARALETVRQVYATDRWFTFPKFEETARYLQGRLEASGVRQVEIGGAHADGKTQAGFWTMPLAWDVKSAKLEAIEPERMELCDYRKVPSCLGMWSGPTPPEGITAELVDLAKTPWTDVKGKLVLTEKNSAGYKFQLVKHGALGAVNGFSENPSLADGRQWINAWGDNGWGFTAASTPLLSFSVTPRQAGHLRAMLASGKKVMLHATADTRYYDGRYPWVTGVLPGATPEEVMVLGHTSEQGAQDNATGVAATVEALHTLSTLIEAGKLPRPRRGIRILLMPEMYGSLSYIAAHRERMERTVAAMTVDSPAAAYDLAGTEYTFYMNPQVATSYTDALALRIAAEYLSPSRPWHTKEYMTGTDAYLGEPTVGVPDVWPYSGSGVITHHNSEDTPADVDPRSLRDLSTVIATYLYFTATAGEEQARWLAEITLDRGYRQMESASRTALNGLLSGHATAGSYGLERISYFGDRYRDAVLSVARLAPPDRRQAVLESLAPVLDQIALFRDSQLRRLRSAGATDVPAKKLPGGDAIVVRRKRFGTIPMDDIPEDHWGGFPSGAWNRLVTTALYWCDGKRNLNEVAHLTEMELGRTQFDFVGYFQFLRKHGYVDFAP